MPCNLAISITKAMLADARRKVLLATHREQVSTALAAALGRKYPQRAVQLRNASAGVIDVDSIMLTFSPEGMMVTGRSRAPRVTEQQVEELTDQARQLVPLIVDELFALEVGRALQTMVSIQVLGKQVQEGRYAGMTGRATVYALRLGQLQGRVMVWPGAQVQIFIDSGTFEQAKAATGFLLQQMQLQNLGVERTSEVEQHRDDVDHIHLIQTQYH